MKRFFSLLLVVFLLLPMTSCTKEEKELKYVFFFIGDGMSFSSIKLAEDTSKKNDLNFDDFDSVGVFKNEDTTSLIPDSASSGSAMATGVKVPQGNISKTSLGFNKDSILTLVKKKSDMKVGIITTVNLNHATPAVFYAHSASRYNYYEIGTYLPKSDFDLFIGGEFLDAEGGEKDLYTLAKEGGYTVLDTKKEIKNIKDKNKKYLIISPDTDDSGMMKFAIDRQGGETTLADYMSIAIDTLYNEKGFFIMCEGGRIDLALHSNDAASAVCEIKDFSSAVDVALDFYKKHPDETLIIVTGDHETGGLSLGYTDTGYTTNFDFLKNQKLSYYKYQTEYVEKYVEKDTPFDKVLSDVEELFGLNESALYDFEIEVLEKAYEKTKLGTSSYTDEDKVLYSNRNPLVSQVTRLVAKKSGLNFSTFVHTASLMPLYAKGKGEENFTGTYDNTDIYNKLYELIIK